MLEKPDADVSAPESNPIFEVRNQMKQSLKFKTEEEVTNIEEKPVVKIENGISFFDNNYWALHKVDDESFLKDL